MRREHHLHLGGVGVKLLQPIPDPPGDEVYESGVRVPAFYEPRRRGGFMLVEGALDELFVSDDAHLGVVWSKGQRDKLIHAVRYDLVNRLGESLIDTLPAPSVSRIIIGITSGFRFFSRMTAS